MTTFELTHGSRLSRDAVGKVVVLRPTRDQVFPLVAGLVAGLPALGLLLAAGITLSAARGAALLVILELLIGGGLAWLAVTMLGDARAHRRFNRRRYEVRFELDRVEIRSSDGVELVPLADVAAHPLLKELSIDGRLFALVRVRDACARLGPTDHVRLILETLALTELDDAEAELGEPEPPARPLFAVFLRPDQPTFLRDPEDIADVRRSGHMLWQIRTRWDPYDRVHAPRLEPGAVTRA